MLKLADLASRVDFDVGPLRISPSRRQIEGPEGACHVEPIVMKVFLILLDAGGAVVSRDELFGNAWGGVFVGDDSLNRAVTRIRKIASKTAPGLFEIETIPRTGYRLTGAILDPLDASGGSLGAATRRFSRRSAIAGATAAASVSVATLWWWNRRRANAQFNGLMSHGKMAIDQGRFDEQTARLFEQALELEPDSATAWGSLALVRSMMAQDPASADPAATVNSAAAAARMALIRNAQEPNGLLGMFELQGSTLDWITRDQRLRQILTIDPRNILALSEFVLLLQAAGLNRESWAWNERALGLQPLSTTFLGRRSLKLWIAGRVAEADKVVDQLRALFPKDDWAWSIRFLLFAMTGRPYAAQAMLDSEDTRLGAPDEVEMWRICLAALEKPSAQGVAKARDACFAGARAVGALAGKGVMIMAALKDVDSAFEIANGFLLSRGKIVRRGPPAFTPDLTDAAWRINTQWLFTPPCAALRTDPRFLLLCEGIGLVDYWRARGVRPDYQLNKR